MNISHRIDRHLPSGHWNLLRRCLPKALPLVLILSFAGCGRRPAIVSNGLGWCVVSSATEEATNAGLEIMNDGGNAVDAAVAVAFALAVTYPQAGNIGGGGFMVIRTADGSAVTIDFREQAPAAATRDMFLDSVGVFVPDRSQFGALAAGTPGAVAGLLTALKKYGTMPIEDVLRPAIELAEEGFIVHPGLAADFAEKREMFLRFPSTARIFAPNGVTPRAGERFCQPDLAETLRRIARDGMEGFYGGRTASLIAAQMRRSGGIISERDLAGYRAVERKPLRGSYRDYEIITMPPPSSGGVLLIEMLNMMEQYNFDSIPYHSARHAHILTEVMRRAYADRAEYLGDPDFVAVPTSGLISKEYAAHRGATIMDRATPSRDVIHGDAARYARESPETTHFSVVDGAGACVSMTTTLNGSFGSKLVVDGAGFFLNNEMDDFSAKPNTPNMYGLVGRDANAIEPGKRMLSSMTPTIVMRDGVLILVLGTPGGSTIITTVLQVIHNSIDYRMRLADAVETPRLHHQWLPDTIFHERGTFTESAADSLRTMGHTLVERTARSGRVDAVGEFLYGYSFHGVIMRGYSDSRGYGAAKGLQ